MSKLDLIIKALQVSYAHVPGNIADRHHEALVAARELMDQSDKPDRAWSDLLDDEIIGHTCECVDDGTFNMQCAIDFARSIQESLQERNG